MSERVRSGSRLGWLGIWFCAAMALGVFGTAYWLKSRPREPRLIGAVSPYYMAEAMTSLAAGTANGAVPGTRVPGGRWFPVPFCLTVESTGPATGRIIEAAECEPFFNAFPSHPICALQNLTGGEWDPEALKLDPNALAVPLAEAMMSRGCRWLVLDMESFAAADRARFTQWSAALVKELRRKIPAMKSTVAVQGKTETEVGWRGAQAQDWAALCRAHDELLILAFDYHYPGSTPEGETAPLSWVEGILRYAISVCPKEKLRLGLAAYGYDWPTTKVITEREWREKGAKDQGLHVENEKQRQEKMELAKRYGVERFFLWAIGME